MLLKVLALLTLLSACVEGGNSTRKDPKAVPNTPGLNTAAINVRSNLHRLRSTEVLTSSQETAQALSLPVGYDEVPAQRKSDDGLTGTSVSRNVRPSVECGLSAGISGVAARIADCAKKNSGVAKWDGKERGNAGEGNWSLVARSQAGKEIWMDETTGFLWSHDVNELSDWCKASGNNEPAIDENLIDCSHMQAGVSYCVGESLLDIPASEIAWRLPTRNDFLQADLNGARFVLPETDKTYWTATVSSNDRQKAWTITQVNGNLVEAIRNLPHHVRCLGHKIR